jgi:hypothetical protein
MSDWDDFSSAIGNCQDAYWRGEDVIHDEAMAFTGILFKFWAEGVYATAKGMQFSDALREMGFPEGWITVWWQQVRDEFKGQSWSTSK